MNRLARISADQISISPSKRGLGCIITFKLVQLSGERYKVYKPHILEGAGHGFLRPQSGRKGANAKGAATAWPQTLAFLPEKLGP